MSPPIASTTSPPTHPSQLNEDAGRTLVDELSATAPPASAPSPTPSLPRARFFQTDVTSSENVADAAAAVVAWTAETHAAIGGIVAAAGVGFPGKALDRKGTVLSMDAFDAVVNINLRGSVDLVLRLLPAMAENAPVSSEATAGSPSASDAGDAERGVIILVSSVAAFDGQPGQMAYAASKGAVASMVLPMARDLAERGIRVNAIAPGVFESAMTAMMAPKVKKSLEGVMEFPKRMGRGEEFAKMVRSMIENVMVNATVIRLDGGVRMPSKM